jgi:hypothetical protein
MENLVDVGIKRIEDWLKATGMKESRLGLLACANPRAVDRVRTEKGSIRTLRQLLDYIEANPAK